MGGGLGATSLCVKKNNMSNSNEILGCFVSGPSIHYNFDQNQIEIAEEKGKIFRNYIWGLNGICEKLRVLKNHSYGNDLELVLFQFYVNPLSEEKNKKEIERYRKKEKSIGLSVIVDDSNFFNKSEEERQQYLKKIILSRLDLLNKVIKRNNLDTMLEALKMDVQELLK
ncbi:MAG: hypothetical protein WAU11_14700 [Ignavibacteriaceae bacterium]